MDGLGEQLQKARAARNLTLDEAARMTKIRPNKLAEIEAEDFSHFPSLAYAKGFVLIYGKFLNVDVSPYLEAFETSEHMTVDGYSYLQDNPAPKPRRTEVVRREPRGGGGGKSSLLPLVIGIVVLIAGFTLLKLMMDIRRIKPSTRDAQALEQASATASPTANTASNNVVAPRALPADATPAPTAVAMISATPEAIATPLATPPVAATAPTPEPTAASTVAASPPIPDSDTEVRRAEPVHAEDLASAPKPTPRPPSPSPRPSATRPRTQTPPVIRSTVPVAPRPTPSRPPGIR